MMNKLVKRESISLSTVSVRLTVSETEEVRRIAEEYNTTVSDIIRQALEISGVLKKKKETTNGSD